ncbi:MAG: lipopolysaccharide assembly protein LapB [Gammaproteobacteria bacterium]|nr:lipopolysaccharide assembly protein LapB [Gammaproteobacteria bacterium]MBU2675449.1 lipopolysaccharide assembly protein LapB [Gammaproteobacteria bacterium]NNC58168.1 lipopolysaccharide assembly protein LapB [Woeseiaceae bacterium]NNL49184.1 lipopolysaccharide assembly protein LapB [Woeseiaceae bacterium]
MPTESTFLLAGLFLLLAAAGWAMGRFGERDEEDAPPPLNIDYLKGLNFLLNEQTDQALEHFLNMVRVDDKTIETHFALGSLFRRRGEVDRAIRIHQNIIARPDLASEQRDQALFSLAKDYLAAGLLDRAEKIFARLAEGSRYQVQALESLCRIYEQEKEWGMAIDAGQRLEVLSGRSLALQIAHYYCERAEAAAAQNDFASAREYVKKAQSGRPRTMRGALTRAHIARDTGDNKTALKLYHRIIDENTYLIAEALPEIVAIYTREDATAELESALKSLLAKNPESSSLIAYTAIVNNLGGIPVIDDCVEQYMLNEPTLGEFIELQQLSEGNKNSHDSALAKVRSALSKLASATPRYQCQECGFSSQRLLWQCPSCRDWETQRPASRVQFDTILQHSITNR